MPISKRVLRVFLSSPGDVLAQRATVRDVVARLNADPLVGERCALELVGWDNADGASIPLGAHRSPQDSVNDYIALPRECDLTIVLLWGRLGTPLPSHTLRADGTAYESGTVWELEDAQAAGREVWIYRDARRPQIDIDDPEEAQKKEQYRRLQAFVGQSRAPDGSMRFGLHEYTQDEELRTWLNEHLRQFVRKTVPGIGESAVPPPPQPVTRLQPRVTAPASLQAADHLGRLIHLCDREETRNALTEKMRERVKFARPRQPLLCVLPGGTRQGHRGFLERIREYEVRSQLPGIGPEHIALVPVAGKLSVDSPASLGFSILRAMREGVKEPGLESWKDLQKWMTSEGRRMFILALEPTSEALRGKERQFLENATAWLAAWAPKPSRSVLILVACVRHAAPTKWFGTADPEAERARVNDAVAQFAASAPKGEAVPEVVTLPELPSLTREDVDLWLDHDVVRQLVGPRLRKAIDSLFDEREYWSMDDLRDRLSAT